MALMICKLYSFSLARDTSIHVMFPEENVINGKAMKVVTLLHDYSEDDTVWSRFTNAEYLSNKYGVVLVMPDNENGFYTNMEKGKKYWDYVNEEILPSVKSFFPFVSIEKENLAVFGVGMGAYGAYHLALRDNSNYYYAGSVYGDMDLSKSMDATGFDRITEAVLGNRKAWDFENAVKENPQFKLYAAAMEDKYIDILQTESNNVIISSIESTDKWYVVSKALEEFLENI